MHPSKKIPEASLAKIINGKKNSLSKKEIFEYNFPNYLMKNILIEQMLIEAKPYDEENKYNKVYTEGRCVDLKNALKKGADFPELEWDHMNGSLLLVIITQAGKTAHNFCSEGRNGVALRSMTMHFRRHALMENITFKYESEIYKRKQEIWADSKWKFYCSGKKFVDFYITSMGYYRDYSHLEERLKGQATEQSLETA